MYKTRKQRILAFILSLAMIIQGLPVNALAAGRGDGAPATDTVNLLAAPVRASGSVPVTLKADDGNTFSGSIPIGKTSQITAENAPEWDGYIYDAEAGVIVEGLKVYEFAIDDEGGLYFSTAENQFAAIELGDREVVLNYKVKEPVPVVYQVRLDGKDAGGKMDNHLKKASQ